MTGSGFRNALSLIGCVLFSALTALQNAPAEELLKDLNGDGLVYYLAFGDSITAGDGDGTRSGQYVSEAPNVGPTGGYAARLGHWLGIYVRNAGSGGERLATMGIYRLPGAVQASSADIIGMMEGTNDVFEHRNPAQLARHYQRAINVVLGLGRQPLLMTLPQAFGEHSHGRASLSTLSNIVRNLAALNEVPYADVERAWAAACGGAGRCELMCMPEGLHPNTQGYDVIAETVAAALLEIDVFAPDGPAQLQAALKLPPGVAMIKPAPEATQP